MAPVLIDTSVLVGMARGENAARTALARLKGSNPVICDIVLAEMIAGARNKKEADHWYEHLRTHYEILPFTREVSSHFREMARTAWTHRGAHISDQLIAATAMAHGCSLLTLNRKDFAKIEGLVLL